MKHIRDLLSEALVSKGVDAGASQEAVDAVLSVLDGLRVYEVWPEEKLDDPDAVMPPPMAFADAFHELIGYIRDRRDLPA